MTKPTDHLPRRDLLGLLGGTAVATALPTARAAATTPTPKRAEAMTGQRIALNVQSRTIEVNGKSASVLGIQQPDGTHGLYTVEQMPFRVHLTDHLSEQTLIHWHGIIDPFNQDGVPHISAPPLHPGQSIDYQFPLRQSGTYWMHSHDGLQIQRLASAPLIIHDKISAHADVQDVVIMLNDFTFNDPRDIFAQLKAGHGSFVTAKTHSKAASPKYQAYLANYRTLSDPEIVPVSPGGRIRLRIINASATENYWIHTGALHGTVIAVDGSPVHPVAAKSVPLAVAQRVDIMVEIPAHGGAFPILAQVVPKTEQTGIILATPGAKIAKLPAKAPHKSPHIGYEFERRLRARFPLNIKHPQIRHRVDLTGDINTYVWKMQHQAFPHITPIEVTQGATVEFTMVNKTAMSHPMHLHGHRFQVVSAAGQHISGAVRDTILVPAHKSVSIAFYADNFGRWAYHCHNLYHQMGGMFTVVAYKDVHLPKFQPMRI